MSGFENIPVPRPVRPYADVLGVEGAAAFLLEFGGAACYFTPNPAGRSKITAFLGLDKSAALARRLQGPITERVPVSRAFVAAVLFEQGQGIAEIARRLHVADSSVRRWLSDERQERERNKQADERQPGLFD